MRAVLLAGGRGTRLRPLTDTVPKPMLAFMGEPYAAGLLRRLAAVGVEGVTVLVGQRAQPWAPLSAIGEAVGVAVDVRTEEAPLDTAGAVRRLLTGPDRPDADVLVCNGDILTDLDLASLVAAHVSHAAVATLALHRVADTSAFGVVVTDGAGRVERFVEKPRPGTLPQHTVNAGTYVLAPVAFDGFPGDGPLSFERAVFPALIEAGAVVVGVDPDPEPHWADLGTPARYLDGHRAVLEGRCDWPAAPGMEVSEGIGVHTTAFVAHSAVLGAGTLIGARGSVGVGARVEGSVLHDDVVVGDSARVRASILADGVVVGDGAQVEESIVAAGVVVEGGGSVPAGSLIARGSRVPAG